MNYNKENYIKVFTDKPAEEDSIKASEAEPSLSYCVQRWLERTPGLQEEGFNFPQKLKETLEGIFNKEWKRLQVRKASSLCLKITENVSFNIASEASYVYILSGQKLIKNAKNGPFWRVFENLKLAVKQCYQTDQF